MKRKTIKKKKKNSGPCKIPNCIIKAHHAHSSIVRKLFTTLCALTALMTTVLS